MSVITLFTVLSVMSIVFFVAVVTGVGFYAVVFLVFVAKITGSDLMLPLKREIGLTVIKVISIQKNNVMVSTFVVSVTFAALLLSNFANFAMKASIGRKITLHTLVAIKA